MRRLPLRSLVTGPTPTPDRLFFLNLWFRDHNNPRYAELLPRLGRLDAYLLTVSQRRVPRGLQYRAWSWTEPLHQRLILPYAGRRYRFMFTTHNEQIPFFPGPIVSDVDDPKFTPREVSELNQPNVVAYVVTAARAARRFEELGVSKPWHVIPQGVSLSSVDAEEIERVSAMRRPGEIVVGYMAAWLLTKDDRNGDNPLHNVEHLLELWDGVRGLAPNARLWLVGGASERLRGRVAGRDDVLVLGRLPRPTALAHVANFDIALYPRTRDQGIQAAKVAEYMGLGVPTVSYDYEVTRVLGETGAGLLVSEPREFVAAVAAVARDRELRGRLAETARSAGAELDWDRLARRYETEVFDRHLR